VHILTCICTCTYLLVHIHTHRVYMCTHIHLHIKYAHVIYNKFIQNMYTWYINNVFKILWIMCSNIYVYTYIYMCTHIYICVHTHIYVYTHIYTNIKYVRMIREQYIQNSAIYIYIYTGMPASQGPNAMPIMYACISICIYTPASLHS